MRRRQRICLRPRLVVHWTVEVVPCCSARSRTLGLAQYTYLVGCQRTGEALLIDPERDIDRYDRIAADEGLRIAVVTETHIHADFLSGVREYAERPDVRIVLSKAGPPEWQYGWLGASKAPCTLVGDGDRFSVGLIEIEVRHTPGSHARAHRVRRDRSRRRGRLRRSAWPAGTSCSSGTWDARICWSRPPGSWARCGRPRSNCGPRWPRWRPGRSSCRSGRATGRGVPAARPSGPCRPRPSATSADSTARSRWRPSPARASSTPSSPASQSPRRTSRG